MIAFVARVYRKLISFSIYLVPLVLLIMRLSWGWESYESGRGHLNHFQDTVDFFSSLHIPFPKFSVMMASYTELVGGILLMVGFASRLICIPLVFNFCVAIFAASHDNVVHIFSQNPKNIVDDTAYPFLITSLIVLAFGPGLLSIDGVLKPTVFKRYAAGLPTIPA